jgi:hypothetical protein
MSKRSFKRWICTAHEYKEWDNYTYITDNTKHLIQTFNKEKYIIATNAFAWRYTIRINVL